jgi:hypothetical protein
MQINFAGGAYETFSKNLNAQECVNFYVHIDQEGGVSQLSLRGTPGLRVWKDTGYPAEVRGVHKFNSFLYAVVGNRVYRVSNSGTSTLCTGTLETSSGYVSMADNGAQMMIVDGDFGYTVVSTTVTRITDSGFVSSPETVTSQDSYFLVTWRNSNYVAISDVGDGTSWDATQEFSAQGYSDNVLSVISDHRDLFALGESTFEVFYNSGDTVPFTRRPGSTQEVGTGAKHSLVKLDNTLFFLSDNYQAVRLEGNNPVAKSTRSVDYQIAQYETKSDAIGMPINIEGNAFYVITFPTANKTWCYNAASNFWHQLTSYPNEGRWRGNCAEYFNGKNIVGDYDNGKLYEVDFDTYTDNSELIRRIRATSAVKNEGKNIFHHQLEIFFEHGVGLITGQGSDPQAMLQYSDDGGHTWSSELWRSAGKIGKYEWRAVWNRLGASRHRNYRLIVTDPVKWVVTGANLEAEIGRT